jgi:hypothetical protein
VDPDETLEQEAQAYERLASEINSTTAAGRRVRVDIAVERQVTARRFAELVAQHTGEQAAAEAVVAATAAGAASVSFECVVVLSGHGDAMLRGTPSFGFVSETEPGKLDVVDPEALVLALAGARSEWRERGQGQLRLMLLNGCLTADTARALAQAGVVDAVGWDSVTWGPAAALFGPALVRAAIGGESAENALSTAKARLLFETQPGQLDEGIGQSLPSGITKYALVDPRDASEWAKLQAEKHPRTAAGVPILASKVASAAAKAAAWDRLHPSAAQVGSSSLDAKADELKKRANRNAEKARRSDKEREVARQVEARLGTEGSSGSSTASSGSVPTPFDAEELEWIRKKVEKRVVQWRVNEAKRRAEQADVEAQLAAGVAKAALSRDPLE